MTKVISGKLKTIKPSTLSGGMEVSKKYYPSVYLTSKDFPELKDWEVGNTYHLGLEVKQVSKEERNNEISASFEIHKIASNPSSSEKQRKMMAIAEHNPEKLYKRNKEVLKMGKEKLSEFSSKVVNKKGKHFQS